MELGERTYVDGTPIDGALALRQHERYQDALRRCGARVIPLPACQDLADCVFVEDTAIVVDEIAVMMSMGAVSRRDEVPTIEAALREFRTIARVKLPARIDGGDVVCSGRDVFVGAVAAHERGRRRRIAQHPRALRLFGDGGSRSRLSPPQVGVQRAARRQPSGERGPDWSLTDSGGGREFVSVPKAEPLAGDVLVIGERIIASDAFPETISLLGSRGWEVIPVSVSEFAKAEGGVTCMSLVFDAGHD